MSAIELRNLTKSYGGLPALQPLDFRVEDGEFLSILGPSGSGKTTLLRMIAGFITPDAGSITIGNQEVSRLPPERRNLGVVFQNYALFPHMSVLDNVAFGLRMRGIGRNERTARAAEALDLVGLSGFEQRLPRQLSGGQQQRVALARAIVIEPAVLLLDEPLGALDLKLRKRMQIELKQLHHKLRRTFIYVTHDQEEALTMSDRVAVMDKGRLLQVDPPSIIYARPRTAFVAEFLGESNLLPGELRQTADGGTVFVGQEGLVVALTTGQGEVGLGKAALAVRPERLRLVPVDAAAAIKAVVETVIFKGPWLSLVAHGAGARLEVLLPNDGRTFDLVPNVGETVALGFDNADVRVVEAAT